MLPGDFIKEAMQKTGTTQSDLAAALGYATQSAISSKLRARPVWAFFFVSALYPVPLIISLYNFSQYVYYALFCIFIHCQTIL